MSDESRESRVLFVCCCFGGGEENWLIFWIVYGTSPLYEIHLHVPNLILGAHRYLEHLIVV